jgi:multisubunit Na+/H+ antiporter MnhB subunit
MGLFWAAIFSLVTAILLLIIDDTGIDIQTSSIPLLIAFLVGVASQLFQHLNPELVKRNALTYLSIFACAVVFFICVWIYMESIIPSWGIWLSIILTALFAYALLPERPR